MRIRDTFDKIKGILKTKTAIKIISIALVLLAIFSTVAITVHFVKSDTADTHTVAFDTNGGSSVAAREVRHGERVAEPSNPTRDGYVFAGWYVYGIPWDFDINAVRESIVMRAEWLEAVTVTFDTGEEIISVQVAKDVPMRESDAPSIYRDDFCGWYIGGLKWDFAAPVTEPVRLNAGYLSNLGFDGDRSELSGLCDALGVTLTEAENGDIALGSGRAPNGVIDLSKYIEYLPHFSAFLRKNPTLSTYLDSEGALLYAPIPVRSDAYSFYINAEWVKILLDGGDFENADAEVLENMIYMPRVTDAVLRVAVDSHGEVAYITKRLDLAGNIIETMNAYADIGGLDGERAAKYLRKYIDGAYSGCFGNERSELFAGNSAPYDTDELVALLRVAAANHSVLGEDRVSGIYVDPDECTVSSLIAELFGIEDIGTELPDISIIDGKIEYSGADAQVRDAVHELNRMISEGLVTFDGDTPTLMRYGGDAGADYTELLPPISRRSETEGESAEYVRTDDALKYNLLYSLSLRTSVLSSRERLMSALRLIDAMYINQ